MKRIILCCAVPVAVCAGLLAAPAVPLDAFNTAWNSPSADHHGSMPFGSDDIALNAWMTGDGDLHFYISKTDVWDDNARLLKVGKAWRPSGSLSQSLQGAPGQDSVPFRLRFILNASVRSSTLTPHEKVNAYH